VSSLTLGAVSYTDLHLCSFAGHEEELPCADAALLSPLNGSRRGRR
jgi:hypothetical protein